MGTTGICWDNAGGIAVVDFQAWILLSACVPCECGL